MRSELHRLQVYKHACGERDWLRRRVKELERRSMGAPVQLVTSTARWSAKQLQSAVAARYGLLQLISVRDLGGDARQPPCGTIVAFDGKRGQILYNRSRDQDPSDHPGCDSQGALLLTGPYRAISVEGSVAIELDLYYDNGQQDPELQSEDEEEESIYWDSKNPEYGERITKRIITGCGPVDVTYIVWSSAAEGSIQVRFIQRDGAADPDDCIHGRITAAYGGFPNDAIVLFDSNGTCPILRHEDLAVPLARSVVAAPFTQSLTITVDLCDHSGREIVSGSLLFHPDELDSRQRRLVGRNSDVEVTITWSD